MGIPDWKDGIFIKKPPWIPTLMFYLWLLVFYAPILSQGIEYLIPKYRATDIHKLQHCLMINGNWRMIIWYIYNNICQPNNFMLI